MKNITKKTNFQSAFTLIELIIILVVLSIMVTIAVPEVLDARKNARALNCGSALKQIESAKSAWAREFPGAPIPNQAALYRYFPNGMFPADPWGIGFQDVTTLNVEASHSYNGNIAFEPKNASSADGDSNGVPDWKENGYNDTGSPTK
jgi:type II secretory pathway pseudopilin PulG